MIEVKNATVYTVGEKQFTDRKQAVEHGLFLRRLDNLEKVQLNSKAHLADEVDLGGKFIALDDIPAFIALNAKAIAEALDVKQFTRTKKAAR